MITLKKQIKKYGNSLVIVFTKEDEKVYNIKKGDIIDVSDIVKLKNGFKRRRS